MVIAMDGSTQSLWPAAMTITGSDEGCDQLDHGRDGHGSLDAFRFGTGRPRAGAGGDPNAVDQTIKLTTTTKATASATPGLRR